MCVDVQDPHVVQRDVLPCQQCEINKSVSACEAAQLLNLLRSKCHDFCPVTNFTPFPSRKETHPTLPGDVFTLFEFDIITTQPTEEMKVRE